MPDHLPVEHLETGRASSAQRQGKFARYFNEKELRVFYRLDTPPKIQTFLDSIPYITAENYRSPRNVLRDQAATCFDGALFGAAALRELVMSYFEIFYNVAHEKTLRSYTVPLNLKTFDRNSWMTSDDHLDDIAERLDEVRIVPVITPGMAKALSRVDRRSYEAGLIGSNAAGFCRPPGKRR